MNNEQIKQIAKEIAKVNSDRIHIATYDDMGRAVEVNAYPKDWLLRKNGQPTSTLANLCRTASEINFRAE